jgi:hypothetical protein
MTIATSTFLQTIFAALIIAPIVILWVAAIVDVIRSHRGGWPIVATLVLILIVPILGPILYFAFRKPEDSAEKAYLAQADLRRESEHRPVGGPGFYS